ncbi:vanadium-dependent haloperoxidase [Roseovarius gahaiensis]|uniref:Vanadium-dependent haloperoxidase n=1 Tax=Roseovarius gahaiensis TaxID=2716691 RepID=A0A967BGP8_9RHOB|nr:vanadium-dependent haloperoxidase [Roseovarius gahaiensis]NHQ75936.1 vanadium-dependent haloperoxidase [Roseovarius gahaiensis]
MGRKRRKDHDRDNDNRHQGAFEIKFIQDGKTHILYLKGKPSDYEIDHDDKELEIEARRGDAEWEFEDVKSFEILRTPTDQYSSAPAETFALAGPLRDYDFFLDDGALIARSRIDGEAENLEDVTTITAGGETFQTASLIAMLETPGPDLLAEGGPRLMTVNTPDPTPSVLWDQILQSVIVETGGGPTNAARAFAIVHTAIYDAQASYDARAQRVSIDIKGDNLDVAELADASGAEIETAMHVAAHRTLSHLFPDQRDMFDDVLSERLDIDISDDSRAHRVGIDAAQDVVTPRLAEAAVLADLSDGFYSPVNPDPATRTDIARWTPEKQGALAPDPDALQTFLTPERSLAEGFALPETPNGLTDTSLTRPDGPEPFFTADQQDAVLNFDANTITLAAPLQLDGQVWQAGHTIPVDKALIGAVINPAFIAQAEAIVQTSATLTEDQKLIAEFWEDGPGTSYPPGAWMTLAQYVSQRDGHDVASDAQLFMTMGNAMNDAAIATWDAKVHFDYARPVTVIRDLGKLGLIGEPGVDDLTGESGYVIQAFADIDPDTGTSLGTRTILAENFITYQLPGGEQSPPFAEYTSGHSTFSAAGAAVLTAFTGSDQFDANVTVASGTSAFDAALPSETYLFEWDTFSQAASDAGVSRIYGGIHFSDANLDALSAGQTIGAEAYDLATDFFTGNAQPEQQPFFDEFLFG